MMMMMMMMLMMMMMVVVVMIVGCLTSQEHASVCPHWDKSCRSYFLSHPGQPVPALILCRQALDKVATGQPILTSLVWLDPEISWRKPESNPRSAAHEADTSTTMTTRQRVVVMMMMVVMMIMMMMMTLCMWLGCQTTKETNKKLAGRRNVSTGRISGKRSVSANMHQQGTRIQQNEVDSVQRVGRYTETHWNDTVNKSEDHN